MSFAERSFTKMYKRNFKISWHLYKKCRKLSRASWEFDFVLNSEQQEIPEQRNTQIYDIASIFTHFCARVRQLLKFSIDTKFWDLIENVLKMFLKSLSTNFVLIAVFVKVALEITKRAQHCVLASSDF